MIGLAECPAMMTHGSVPLETRIQLGIFDNLVRLSVGIEDLDDIIEDVEQALQATLQQKKILLDWVIDYKKLS